jgi:DNA-3-methyladenine glycosylase II
MVLRTQAPKNDPVKHPKLNIPLPSQYSVAEVLDFHGRDTAGISEQVSETGLRKGVLLANIPAVIAIEFNRKLTNARCTIFADGDLTGQMLESAKDMCIGMLGLKIDPDEFFAFAIDDTVFGPLLVRRPRLRIIQSASIFEALTWAVMGQQINVAFAISLRRTFIQQAGRLHSSGLRCYPEAEDVARLDIEQLTRRQFSRSKAETLVRLAHLMSTSALNLVMSETNTIEQIVESLLKIKGIGPWTVNYALLRGFAYADCSLHGDVAVRTAIHRLTGGESRPEIAAAEAFLKRYAPHRTMAAAYLWDSLTK